MAKQTAKRVEEAPKVKKQSSVKVRAMQDAKVFLSKPGTDKLDELTEAQLIEQGYRNPFYVAPNFKKTDAEKEELKKLRSKFERTPGNQNPIDFSFPALYTIQVKRRSTTDNSPIKTTYSAKLKVGEIYAYEKSLSIPDDVRIVKKTYNGEVVWEERK